MTRRPPLAPHPLRPAPGESDAYSYLSAKSRLSLREDDARQLMHDVLLALNYMHEQVGVMAGGKGRVLQGMR